MPEVFAELSLVIATYSTPGINPLGIRNFVSDDYLMLDALIYYTILCVALNRVASGGAFNLMTLK
ncbi:hypothetical protein N7513_002355 [Penicillium frequentans]|nr:hypothetical protein N7513_002355 [Penicillium glabrum]